MECAPVVQAETMPYRAAVAFENGDMAGNQVNQRAWDKEKGLILRAPPSMTALPVASMLGRPADTGADNDTDAVFVEGFQIVQA